MRYPSIFLIILLILFYNGKLFAQCSGALGDPIINIDFGSGTSRFGPALNSGITNYNYVTVSPKDGQYTLVKTVSGLNSGWIQNIVNHTPNDPNGYMMLVNASHNPDIFYQATINGLCPNTTYEFSAYIINILISRSGVEPNIKFTIENDGTIIKDIPTGSIPAGNANSWVKYGTTFTTPLNLGTITLKMTNTVNNNNGIGGNDLALDDIVFRACGPELTPSIEGGNSTFTTLCEGDNANFKFKTATTPGVYQDPRFQWQKNTGTGGFTDIPGETNEEIQVSFVNAARGVYQYRLVVADGDNINSPNCRVSGSPLTVEVNPRPIANITTAAPVCVGDPIQLRASGGTSYKWSGPNLFTSDDQNPIIRNATKAMAGAYSVTVTARGCDAVASTNVQILDPVIVTTNVQSATICEGKSVQLEASGGTAYLWSPAKGLSDSQGPNPIASPTETTIYTVRVSNGACSETAEITVNVNKNAIADAGGDQKILSGQTITLNGKVTGDDFTYFWTASDYLDDPSKLNPIATPTEDITYTLHAISNLGCTSTTDDVFIKVYPKVIIPNSFSPNGDSVNDTWNIPAAISFTNPIIKVTNRYGQLVYESKGTFKPWDGKFNGKELPPAAYYYTIYLNEDFQTYSGWVMLIR
ncbi:gliding motility-associated C-terminal domain-containing protein [Pedobacter frigidisoli]|uniref:Gliding motility-associated C-terminal domain-containing protein n=1 Tax=Pedobacter frigidisoli TaxID=2530455 RepID=A0A4R0P389_9SPHI|nr:gliding motility-associated C-terminal domain-containing protein [Pedobacter frigidisoli]TCD08512.1 gliding motility-associated C-terminal domain-containing protein [Pedobacter frigidisoli]